MTVMGEKLGRDPQIGQLVCCELGQEPFFSGAVGSVQLCWVSIKGYRVRLVMSAYMSCVLGFSCRMYINSNHHDSQI
jgi:hypothetical protein